jgi:GTPase SAR1 family protein
MANKKNDTLSVDTYKTFFKVLFFGLVLSFFASLFAYLKNKIHPDFFASYLTYKTIYSFCAHFTIFVYFFLFCFYSLFFKRKYLFDSNGKQRNFYQIVSSGFNLIIISLFFYLFILEVMLPFSKEKCADIVTKCRLSEELLDKAEKLYSDSNNESMDLQRQIINKKEALRIYENYGRLVSPNRYVNERIGDLRTDLYRKEHLARKHYEIPQELTTYEELADYFYSKEDYFSAWFYYLSVEKGPLPQKQLARKRIEDIKQKIKYQNSLYTDEEMNLYMDKQTRKIQRLYSDLQKGERLFNSGDYLSAFYIYNDIYNENTNIRDAKNGRDKALEYLQKNAVDIEEADIACSYAGKENFMMFCNDNVVMKIGVLRKAINVDLLVEQYFFFDTQLCYRDVDENITKVIYIPFAKVRKDNLLLLCYDKSNRENIYSPVIEKISKAEMSSMLKKTSDVKKAEFLSYYELNDNFYELRSKEKAVIRSLSKLTRENKFLDNDGVEVISIQRMNKKLQKLSNDAKTEILSFYEKKDDDYVLYSKDLDVLTKLSEVARKYNLWDNELRENLLSFPYDMSVLYRLAYDYESAEDFSLFKLLDLRKFYDGFGEFDTGLSHSFIGAAIACKLSKLFIFLYVSCILLSMFFRLRALEYNSWYLVILPFVLVILYILVMLINLFVTTFFNVLGSVFNLGAMFVATIAIHFVLSVVVICYTMLTEVDSE